jgi:hypothetical protein
MARDYGKVHASFWTSDTLTGLTDDAKLLALYLLTCPHANIAGVFRLPMAYAVEDMGWDAERLRNGFETLSAAGFCRYDKSGWLWIVKWLKWNKPDNQNMWKAVDKAVAQVPVSVSFHAELMSPRETVSEPLGNLPSPSPSLLQELFPAIPLDDGTDYTVPTSLATELAAAFPSVNLAAELAKARTWCIANPTGRKTRRGVGRFLNGWMERAAKNLTANTPPPTKRRLKELA